jgi:hypothetical protein
MDGGGLEQAGSLTQVATPPLTTLDTWVRLGRWGGEERGLAADICPARLARLRPQRRGEAEWRGARRDDRPAVTLLRPPPPSGGETGGGPGVRVERRGPSPTRVSSVLSRVSSEEQHIQPRRNQENVKNRFC